MSTSPLNPSVPIVDAQGRPTPIFMRWWQDQQQVNDTIMAAETPEQVSAILDLLGDNWGEVLYRDQTGWNTLSPGADGRILRTNGSDASPTWDTVATLLDQISTTRGTILYRGEFGWTTLAPGSSTAEEYLKTGGPGADPSWDTPAGGGGGGSFAFQGFRAKFGTGSSDQAVSATTDTTIIFPDTEFDTNSGYSTVTGEFTIPSAWDGKYAVFYTNLAFNATEFARIHIRRDGTRMAREVVVNNSQAIGCTTGPLLVATGEVYDVMLRTQSAADVTGDREHCMFSGHVVGE